MAIFRKARRPRGNATPERVRAPRPNLPALAERLAKIAADAAAPEDVFEPALAAFLEASGARAGALCLFDPRHGVLRLAAEHGMSEEGCRRLRTVRRGDPTAWDMPLHGLVNRRAYLIESAAHNRYVPRLVENAGAVRTIACVPLYAGPIPVGSLVLVAVAPRSFGERDVHSLEPGLAGMARLIEATRRRAGGEPVVAIPASVPATAVSGPLAAERDRLLAELTEHAADHERLTAELTTRRAEAERLGAALDAAVAERRRLGHELEEARRGAEKLATASAALAAAERERARLAEALEASAADRAEQARALATLDAARAAAEQGTAAAQADLAVARRAASEAAGAAATRLAEQDAARERLQARLVEAEAVLARERELARVAERDRDRTIAELRTAVAHERRLREEREMLAAGGATAARADVERALAAAEAEAAAARAEAEIAAHVVEALEDEATHAHAEIGRLVGELGASRAAVDPLAEELAGLRRRAQAAAERTADDEREITRLRRELDRLATAAPHQEAERTALVARLESVAAERDRLRESDATGAAERDRLAARAAAAEAAAAVHEEALARETAERQRLAGTLAEIEIAHAAAERTHARREADAAARLAALEEDLARLAAERGEAGVDALPAETSGDEASARPMRVVTVGGGARPIRPREGGEAGHGIAIVDVDPEWETRIGEDRPVTVLAPDRDLAARLAELAPERVVVNLAGPGVLGALPALRAAGCTARFWACIATPGTNHGLALGSLEPAPGPLEPEAVIAALGPYTDRGTRVVTAGVDVDALMSLRQALARRGMSVSMAWDAKQAADLLGVVRPEVVVVDLDLPRRDGFSIVARLATVDPTPHAVLVGGADVADAFAAMLGDAAVATRVVPLPTLIGVLATRRERQPAAESRPKLRALGLTRK